MGNLTSTKLTQTAKSNRKSKFGRLEKIFQCFKGEEDMEETLKKTNAIEFDGLCPEPGKNDQMMSNILPRSKIHQTGNNNCIHEKHHISILDNKLYSPDNKATSASIELSPSNCNCQLGQIDNLRQMHSSPTENGYKSLLDINGPTFDTRDRRFRPKAAKGTRTLPVSSNMDIYLPGAVFAITAED
ncbi:hypothetical protein CHS0354_042938 [Potamilus streckersoni]|uniref:Uncharacterized protein n=1 Tax=Potamilus streckersoni TaxID=2493646 RepID=A0AAE0W6H4_9BIVA|nr:hypothetical protein CHS0354_042938 [Potamilus streckersoni]